jgi:hypothetical protein
MPWSSALTTDGGARMDLPLADSACRSFRIVRRSLLLVVVSTVCLAQGELLPIIVNGKGGYIDETGRVVIQPEYLETHRFSEGLAVVRKGDDPRLSDSRLGYINRQGEFHGISGAELLGGYCGGLARARFPSAVFFPSTRWCFIDHGGSVVIRSAYENVGDFSEGLAWVEIKRSFLFWVISDTYGYIDRTGALVIPAKFDGAGNFSEGLANVTLQGKKGYINLKGELVIAPEFEAVGSFSMGLAAVRTGGKWGYIDTLGRVVIPPGYEDARMFSGGVAPVKVSGNWGFISRSGETAVTPAFSDISGFREGLSAAKVGGKWGYIDTTGQFRIAPRFDYAQAFAKGTALVELDQNRGYIDMTGRFIWGPAR